MADHHKDLSPDKTLKKIKGILNNIGLTEDKTTIFWNKAYDSCFSCTLVFNEYPTFRSNGKGLSKKLALASAYAEFIERLQCYSEYAFFTNGLTPKTNKNLLFSYKHINTESLLKNYPFLGHKISEENLKILPKKLLCLPFTNPCDNSTHYLPYFHFLTLCRSNGMCAGNTFEEAVCQGICEVFERHILTSLHENKIKSLPNIPLDKINIQSLKLKRTIKDILNAGISITIKDCTLNGFFPVVCVICEDTKNNMIGIDFGADPILEIALQRCITELFQGRKKLTVNKQDLNFKDTKNHDVTNNPNLLFEKLMKEGKFTPNYIKAFAKTELSNKEYLKFLLSKTKKLGLRVFVHDFSFLNFPSYFVFIEKLSYLYSQEMNSVILHKYNFEENTEKLIYKLANSTKREKTKLLELLDKTFNLDQSLYFFDLFILRSFKYYTTMLNPRFVYVFLLIDSEKYLEAQNQIKKILSFNKLITEEEADFIKILADFVNLKIESVQSDKILDQLNKKYEKSLYKESLPHLLENNWSSFLQKDPIDTFYYKKFDLLPVPNCLGKFNCHTCGIKKNCFKEKGLQIKKKLKDLAGLYPTKANNQQNLMPNPRKANL